jgi:hypothetical protein
VLQPPHLTPLLQLPELQRDGAAKPLLIAAGQLPAVNACWMTRTHFVTPLSASTARSEAPQGRLYLSPSRHWLLRHYDQMGVAREAMMTSFMPSFLDKPGQTRPETVTRGTRQA